MSKPFFSFIIPCCDVAPYVRECLDSVLTQTESSWECIIGVETSKDGTEEIVREYTLKDPRFKMFTAERSGSCSASRNTGTDMAAGEYVIFLDGDDLISDGSLKRIRNKIESHPGADLYPAAIVVCDGEAKPTGEIRDNYPERFEKEMTGPEATVLLEKLFEKSFPCPMLQLTVFRREFLVENNLKCIYGLRHQDSEFSPRALYLAKRVIPIHEPFYLYRIRENSVQTKIKAPGSFHKDLAIRLKSLIDFHAAKSREPGFDKRISKAWARRWTGTIFKMWFAPASVAAVPEALRRETLEIIFADGTDNFKTLLSSARLPARIAGRWVLKSLSSPAAAQKAARLFKTLYFPLLSKL